MLGIIGKREAIFTDKNIIARECDKRKRNTLSLHLFTELALKISHIKIINHHAPSPSSLTNSGSN